MKSKESEDSWPLFLKRHTFEPNFLLCKLEEELLFGLWFWDCIHQISVHLLHILQMCFLFFFFKGMVVRFSYLGKDIL